eukprot:GHUV01033660.1.p1 GENE.GHUV01033660.1~~GHUV01033660.1.p1  ORF type:complete len:103 (+),score=16.99 GHUV01033660.1:119-427(+)
MIANRQIDAYGSLACPEPIMLLKQVYYSANDPALCAVLLQLAVLERRRGDFAAAARCFKRGTACAPCNPHLWYAWAAMTWKDCNDYRAARRLYEQATTYCPR